jgi:hypothetical protein
MMVSRGTLSRLRNVSDNICRENQNTNFMFNNCFPEYCAVYKIMLKKYMVVADRLHMKIQHGACALHAV